MALKLAQPGLGCFPWLAWVDRDHIVDLPLLLSPPGGPKVPTCPHFCYYASRGYVFATVDVRGRGNSEGEFEPFRNEDKDGHDVVEWLAAQPWSNGKVGMYGASYGGWDQWATAKELPPGPASIVPAAAAYLGTDFPFVHNVFVPYNMTWLTFTSGNAAQATIFGDMEMWTAAFTERVRRPPSLR